MSDDTVHERNAVDGVRGNVRVRARPVDAMLEPLNLSKIDLIKMNIEGAEVTALAGMNATLARTEGVVISCHDFLANGSHDPRRTKAQVITILETAGFTTVVTRPAARHNFVRAMGEPVGAAADTHANTAELSTARVREVPKPFFKRCAP